MNHVILTSAVIVLLLYDAGMTSAAPPPRSSLEVAEQLGRAVDVQRCGRAVGTWHKKGTNAAPFYDCLQRALKRTAKEIQRFNRMVKSAQKTRERYVLRRLRQCFTRSYAVGGVEFLGVCLNDVERMVKRLEES